MFVSRRARPCEPTPRSLSRDARTTELEAHALVRSTVSINRRGTPGRLTVLGPPSRPRRSDEKAVPDTLFVGGRHDGRWPRRRPGPHDSASRPKASGPPPGLRLPKYRPTALWLRARGSCDTAAPQCCRARQRKGGLRSQPHESGKQRQAAPAAAAAGERAPPPASRKRRMGQPCCVVLPRARRPWREMVQRNNTRYLDFFSGEAAKPKFCTRPKAGGNKIEGSCMSSIASGSPVAPAKQPWRRNAPKRRPEVTRSGTARLQSTCQWESSEKRDHGLHNPFT